MERGASKKQAVRRGRVGSFVLLVERRRAWFSFARFSYEIMIFKNAFIFLTIEISRNLDWSSCCPSALYPVLLLQ